MCPDYGIHFKLESCPLERHEPSYLQELIDVKEVIDSLKIALRKEPGYQGSLLGNVLERSKFTYYHPRPGGAKGIISVKALADRFTKKFCHASPFFNGLIEIGAAQ